uniref:Uncharacterized protein n=1 Tax=Octopus bimaculoides TaxID=37653 RepID=A0A0L8I3D3_OCTBM
MSQNENFILLNYLYILPGLTILLNQFYSYHQCISPPVTSVFKTKCPSLFYYNNHLFLYNF